MSDKPHEKTRVELHADVEAARVQLAATLDAIEDRLNVPKRVKRATRQTTENIRTITRENPLVLVGIAVGAAAVVGGAVWAIVAAITKD